MRLTRLDLGIALALTAGTVAAFGPAFRADFIGLDDPIYVTSNRHVVSGVNFDNFCWAWTFYASNWHPLTWLSLQLDASLFGKAPAGYHAENVALHAASAVVLFLALRALTGAAWRSGIVAALFAWHPLRVESVVWVAERKDVLSIFFGLLSLWAYAGYARRRSLGLYLAVAVSLTLSLLAKPTLVTLPCLMLVLDWWPLNRSGSNSRSGGSLADLSESAPRQPQANAGAKPARPNKGVSATGGIKVASSSGVESEPRPQSAANRTDRERSPRGVARAWLWLSVEKLPLLALCLASSVVTYFAQQSGGSVRPFETLGIGGRVANALVAYATYPGMAVWPVNLAPIYPYRQQGWPEWRVALSALVVVALTALAVWQRRRRPYLLAGWLWYLGTLVPVIGLVQVGNQAYADRYTYFPFIGLCLAVAWALAEALSAPRARQAAGLATAAALLFAALTWRQASFWKDDATLWPHTLEVTGPNAQAYNSLGIALESQRRLDEAMKYYKLSVNTSPSYGTALYNLGRLMHDKGREEEATVLFLRAIRGDHFLPDAHLALGAILSIKGSDAATEEQFRSSLRQFLKTLPPDDPFLADPNNGLAPILSEKGLYGAAEAHFRAAVRLNPENALARDDLGRLLDLQGRYKEAIEQYGQALRVDPDDASAHSRLGVCLARSGDLVRSAEHFRRAVQLRPRSTSDLKNLGVALEKLNKGSEAIACFRRAVEIEPNEMSSRLRLASCLARLGETAEADAQYLKAHALDAGWPDEVIHQARLRATSPRPRDRDAETAVWAAETACSVVRPPPATYLDTLAAAYAEAGRFPEAIAAAEKAVAAADAAGKPDLARAMAGRLALYRDGHPYRETAPPAPR
jgi:tetratricopeptide (TPR) repeat protein